MTPLNPDYPYLVSSLKIEKWRAEIWLKVFKKNGKLDHPIAKIAKENIAFAERELNERQG